MKVDPMLLPIWGSGLGMGCWQGGWAALWWIGFLYFVVQVVGICNKLRQEQHAEIINYLEFFYDVWRGR